MTGTGAQLVRRELLLHQRFHARSCNLGRGWCARTTGILNYRRKGNHDQPRSPLTPRSRTHNSASQSTRLCQCRPGCLALCLGFPLAPYRSVVHDTWLVGMFIVVAALGALRVATVRFANSTLHLAHRHYLAVERRNLHVLEQSHRRWAGAHLLADRWVHARSAAGRS